MGMGMGNWNGKVPPVPGDESIILGSKSEWPSGNKDRIPIPYT